jgi:biofilm PGA synthesis N-glycosyltransferase PgaC
MQVPGTFREWWRQRTRWARGLGQVLRVNAKVLRHWKMRRMWLIWIEGALSTLWSHLFAVAVAFWAIALAAGVYGFAGNPIPNFWGLMIASILFVQITVGLLLDGRYDPAVRRYGLWLPWYPLIYWALTAAAAVRATAGGLFRSQDGPVTWTGATRLRDDGSPEERRAPSKRSRSAYRGPERRRAPA